MNQNKIDSCDKYAHLTFKTVDSVFISESNISLSKEEKSILKSNFWQHQLTLF